MNPRPIVPDASVAVKWLVDEEFSEEAASWRDADGVTFHVPDLWYLEIGSALWKRLRRVDPAYRFALLHDALDALRTVQPTVYSAAILVERAVSLALETGLSVSDASYAAVAELEHATLITADARLARSLAGHTSARIELLGQA